MRRTLLPSDENQEAKHFSVRFGVFAEEVIEAVLAVKPKRSVVDDLVKQ
jgi:hypothetical protein